MRLFLISLALSTFAAAQTPGDQLKALKLSTATITVAESVPAGAFRVEGQPQAKGKQATPLQVPAFCRIAATLAPSSDSSVTVSAGGDLQRRGQHQRRRQFFV